MLHRRQRPGETPLHRSPLRPTRYDNYDEAASEVEIGWTFLARPFWGGVYNADLKRVMLEHAFRSVETVVFLVGAGNVRSRRAVERLGATECGARRGMVLYAVSCPRQGRA